MKPITIAGIVILTLLIWFALWYMYKWLCQNRKDGKCNDFWNLLNTVCPVKCPPEHLYAKGKTVSDSTDAFIEYEKTTICVYKFEKRITVWKERPVIRQEDGE